MEQSPTELVKKLPAFCGTQVLLRVHNNPSLLMPCITFRNKADFYGEELLPPSPNTPNCRTVLIIITITTTTTTTTTTTVLFVLGGT
jgi:hypothetical protein